MTKETFPEGIKVCVQEKSWFDVEIICDWIKMVRMRHSDGLLKEPSLTNSDTTDRFI